MGFPLLHTELSSEHESTAPPVDDHPTSANSSTPTADVRQFRTCSALTKKGKPCGFAARKVSGLCINHDPAYAEQQKRNVFVGWYNSAHERSRRAYRFDLHEFNLAERPGIQALIETAISLELASALPIHRSRNLHRLIALAMRNLGNVRVGWVEPYHWEEAQRFKNSRHFLRQRLPDLIQAIAQSESQE